jgi:hypothetical protein
MRLRQRGKVADGPRYNVPVAVQIAFAPGGGSQNTRDIPSYRWFLGEHGHCRIAQVLILVSTAGFVSCRGGPHIGNCNNTATRYSSV